MKKHTCKLLSTVLTATTVMSMLTAVPVGAVDNFTEEKGGQPQIEAQGQELSTVENGSNMNRMGKTGDLSLEYGIPDDATIIDSVGKYYKTKGKKYKVPSGSSASVSLPESVDNSKSEYFPAVGNQGGIGSCAAWAQAYYQFTYTMNKERGVKTTPENSFSPKWAYDLVNGGADIGSVDTHLYNVMQWQGVAPMSLAPYDNDYLSWSPTEEAWSAAIKYRVKDYQFFEDVGEEDTRITSADDSDLDVIKTALSNGDVLAYSTCIYSWISDKIKENPMAPENSKYVGEDVITVQNGYAGGHRMALVGYNDNIWTDINNNDKVDNGEMGAFKIVNSWGEGYGNDGFAWVAYDALNRDVSCVEGAPEYSTKADIFNSISRINVQPVSDNSDMYLKCTLNTSNRSDVDVHLVAERNGVVDTAPGFATTKYDYGVAHCAYDGSNNLSDGTLAFALNNVVPDISSENFHEYTWSVRIVDKENNDAVLTVKDIAIVDSGENKVYTPKNFNAFTLNGDEKTVDITESDLNDVVIYYVGYFNPKLHYKVGNGEWTSTEGVPMIKTSERYGYTHKYIIESDDAVNVTLYFTDENGSVDNNNGKYYTAGRRLNYYVTENIAEPLKVSILDSGNVHDVVKYIEYSATASGGYEPYRYEYILKNLDTGKEEKREYDTSEKAGFFIVFEGNYKVTVNVKDQSNKVVSDSTDLCVKNLSFNFSSLTATPDKHIMTGDTVEFKAVTDSESVIAWGDTFSMYEFTIKNTDTDKVVYNTSKRSDEINMNKRTSTIYLSWVPRKAGNYSVTVSSTDGSKDYAEKTLNFNVAEYNGTLVGDANNDNKITIADAVLVMRYMVGLVDSSEIWLPLADCDNDKNVDLKDVICIQKYVLNIKNSSNVGNENYRELPTEPTTATEPVTVPPTEPITVPPTEPPTVVPPTEPVTVPPTEPPTEPQEKNIVTFTNSFKWGGTISCYYWSKYNTQMTTWPGKPMTYLRTNSYGENMYTFEVPKDATYIIFTNGSAQTTDISYPGGEVRYYPLPTTDSKGHNNVATW